jgi:hypothetical protein
MPIYPVTDPTDYYDPAREEIEEVITDLSGEAMATKDHAEVEDFVEERLKEVKRRLMQGHLDQRSTEEEAVPVVGSDGVKRTHRRTTDPVQLMTIFGVVTLARISMSARGKSALMPLDAALNMPNGLYSFGVRQRLTWEVATGSYEQAIENLERTTGASVSKRQAEEAVIRAMVDFDAFYAFAPVIEVPPRAYQVLTFDGKGIVMRREGLRPATRKAAEQATAKLGSRLSPGEKKNRKRMAEVAAVYSITPWIRTTDQVLKTPGCGPLGARPRPHNKRVWASVVEDAQTVIHDAFVEAAIRDPHLERQWIVLVDGNKDQLRYVRQAATEIGHPVTVILDIIHAIEYVWKAAWALYDKGDRAAERWVLDKLRRLLDGKVSTVAAGIRRSGTLRGLKGSKRQAIDKCANYLLKHKAMMRYDLYLAAGMPIGTGVIEGACRHLINDRMDITGARWGLEGAEAVLQARALRICGHLDAYWDFHRRRELEHNHLIHYDKAELSHLREAA